VVEASIKVLGRKHPDTLSSMASLSATCTGIKADGTRRSR